MGEVGGSEKKAIGMHLYFILKYKNIKENNEIFP